MGPADKMRVDNYDDCCHLYHSQAGQLASGYGSLGGSLLIQSGQKGKSLYKSSRSCLHKATLKRSL
jgi:hypothetical protein